MAKKDLHLLTDLQLAILREVWKRGTATVTDVHASLLEETGLAKKSIGTMMARLERQGFLSHRADGREFLYSSKVTLEEVGRAKVRNVLDVLFAGNLPALVSHALESKDVAPGDVERVRALISGWEKKKKGKERT